MSDSEKPKSWKERRQSIKHKWLVPFVYPEWLCERFSYFLGQWAFLDILGHAGRLAILVALISYIMGGESRQKAKHYQAWQVINLAQGKSGSGGRMDALQDLYSDGVSLVGVDISQAYLPELNLENANLSKANFARANLEDANFAGAWLMDANLADADLEHANFAGADLADANLVGAYLTRANLAGAVLADANLAGAYLTRAKLAEAWLSNANLAGAWLKDANLAGARLKEANLAGANLSKANLARTDLEHANFAGAELAGANLDEANLRYANLDEAMLMRTNLNNIRNWQDIKSIEQAMIYDVNNPPDGFIEWATEHGAVSIESRKEWKKLLQEKRQEQTKEKQ